jgi:tetratricopeptide (TPR) repeat protein
MTNIIGKNCFFVAIIVINSHLHNMKHRFRLYITGVLVSLSVLVSNRLWSQEDSSFYYTNKLLRQSPTRKDSLKNCIAFMKYWQNNANYKNLGIYAEKGLKLAFILKDSTSLDVADAYTGLGITCLRTMKSAQAIGCFNKAEKLLSTDAYRLTYIQLQRGLMFYFNQDYAHALEIFKTVDKKSIELKKTNLEAMALMDIGNIFFERIQPDSALKYYNQGLHTLKPEELYDSTLYMSLYMNIGNVYSSMMKHGEAKSYLLKAYEPAEILTFMNTQIIEKLFKSNPDGAKDGMDITVCKLNLLTKDLIYSGAKNDLYLVSDRGLEILGVDKNSIGYNANIMYTQANYRLTSNGSVYLFSNGYCDQKGGAENKKFMKLRFKKLLQEIYTLPCAEQKEKIHATFTAWKGEHAQRDDILVVGFRV